MQTVAHAQVRTRVIKINESNLHSLKCFTEPESAVKVILNRLLTTEQLYMSQFRPLYLHYLYQLTSAIISQAASSAGESGMTHGGTCDFHTFTLGLPTYGVTSGASPPVLSSECLNRTKLLHVTRPPSAAAEQNLTAWWSAHLYCLYSNAGPFAICLATLLSLLLPVT